MTVAARKHLPGWVVVVAHHAFARHFRHFGMNPVTKEGGLIQLRRTCELFHQYAVRPGSGGMVHSSHLAARTTPEAWIEFRRDLARVARQAIVPTLI